MPLDDTIPSEYIIDAWENHLSPEFHLTSPHSPGMPHYDESKWEDLTKLMESSHNHQKLASPPRDQHSQPGTRSDTSVKDHTSSPKSQNVDHGQLYETFESSIPVQHKHDTRSTRKGKEIIAKEKGRRPPSGRYEGYEWQAHFSHDEQDQIYSRIRAWWGPYERLRYRTAYNALRKMLNVELAKKILQGVKTTIDGVAKETYHGQRARMKAVDEGTSRRKRWPDRSLPISKRKMILDNLQDHWKGSRMLVIGRLRSHYEPRLAKALLNRENSAQFNEAASFLHQRTSTGKFGGTTRVLS